MLVFCCDFLLILTALSLVGGQSVYSSWSLESTVKGAGEILREILSSRIRTKSGGACSIGTRKGVSGSGSPRDRNGVENGGREDATFLRPPW